MDQPTRVAAAMRRSVDVVIPVFNGALYIGQALHSVLAQDLLPAQIIVVDDGSTDATAQIVQRFSDAPVPVRYHYQPNRGLSAARNAGIRLCTGEYVAFLDADDEWYPHKLASQMELFSRGEWDNLGAVYCRYDAIDAEGCISTRHFIVEPDPLNRGYIFERLLDANLITGSGSGILMRRACFDSVGGFDEEFRACEDWDMWLRLAQAYQFDYVDQKLVRIRMHSQNMQKNSRLIYASLLMFYNKWAAAAFRCGRHTAWRKAIVGNIVRDLPDLDCYRRAEQFLSKEARGYLFHGASGSILPFLLLKIPSIVIIMAKRILRCQE